ncbi:hypothetical protein BKA65DRAFT_486394 [Rhexocercosporidium sp. MPI-PUGE-AT-0058]|nr:hypothetical protein BKA65DRAFT_486394 [Rhexocercosporidium sp. MPI-PUGE-AT-0058]
MTSAPPTNPTIPQSLTSYFTLHTHPPNHPLPLCIQCQAAVLPKSLLDHLRKHHHLPPELRSVVRSFITSLPDMSKSVDFKDVRCNTDEAVPVVGLRVVGAWRCKMVDVEGEGECSFIRRDVTDIRRHVNLVHGAGAGGMYEACRAQSWFGGRRAVYWRVCEAGDGDSDEMEGEGDVVMSDEKAEEGTQNGRIESGLDDGNINEKKDGDDGFERSEKDAGEGPKRLQTSIFTSICRWGFYGKGFGDKTPKSWREGEERELGTGMMF